MKQLDCVITLTGDRPIQAGICIDIMNTQTVKPKRWIVIDDGSDQTFYQILMKRSTVPVLYKRLPGMKENSLCRNMLEALRMCAGSCAIIEDDDCYPADYLERMGSLLDQADLVGAVRRRYYHIGASRFYPEWHDRLPFSVLHATCFNAGAVRDTLVECCAGDYSLDRRLWASFKGEKLLHTGIPPTHLVGWGIGRAGTTQTHAHAGRFQPDESMVMFKHFTGEQYKLYKPYLETVK